MLSDEGRRTANVLMHGGTTCGRDMRLLAESTLRLDAELAAYGAGPPFEHGMNCPALSPGSDDDCTCGLYWRKALGTEQTMHAAWRKRAEEAEAELAAKEGECERLRNACGDAYMDIGHWLQLARRQMSDMPDWERNPLCPTASGVGVSNRVREKLAAALSAEVKK